RSHSPTLSSTTRPPPPTTLFPYTTLFRSPDNAAHTCRTNPIAMNQMLMATCQSSTKGRHHRDTIAVLKSMCTTKRGSDLCLGGRDRKSTRLNSSHDQISYAVFCLKKKKEN